MVSLVSVLGVVFFLKDDRKKETPISCVEGIEIFSPFSRETTGKNGAAFMKIKNRLNKEIKLKGATLLEANACDRIELHDHIVEKKEGQEIFKMVQVEDILIPAQETGVLKPKSKHIMFMGLNAPLKEGDNISLSLDFGEDGNCTIPIPVLEAGSQGPCHCHHKKHRSFF